MNVVATFFRSSIGGKITVAITGAGLFLFVVMHMLGNLQIYLGQDALNHYAELLHTIPELLWIARAGLLAFVILHIVQAVRLQVANRAARPVRYAHQDTVQATIASRSMLWTGAMIAAFIVFHLLHFTLGVVQPDTAHLTDSQGRHDVYSMVVYGFQNVPISISYIIAMVLLGLHLRHGVASLFQTLGLRNARFRSAIDKFGLAAAWIIVIGNVSIPLSVLTGIVRLPSS